MKREKLKEIESTLPEFFTMVANAMKAGLSFPQALQMASQEGPSPLKEEFKEILEKINLGWSLEEALLAKESALKLADFSLMVHSVLILRQTGGNFVPHFENLAHILRERKKVSSKIRLQTTQGMTQGVILGFMPLGLGLALFCLSPEFISPLWESALGWIALCAILILDAGGWLWMRHLARIEI
ncbi:MAG: hypothetical protein A3H42_00175 [Deltaproteobacteria bacterium RIFCSPLOWO2_02_FULL_46_8]|nr:MAG: hypothetical protein A3H42_00175 [Deltaproteobacteria bacterium RIFCSPLOWO2_02_FULL_46_8]